MFIIFLYTWLLVQGAKKQIYINLRFVPDYTLTHIIQGSEVYDLPPNSFSERNEFSFKGHIGEPTQMMLFNDGWDTGLGAIITIGTMKFTTNTYDYWTPPPEFNRNSPLAKIDNQDIKIIGMERGGINQTYTMIFTSPVDRTYCSTLDSHGKPPIAFLKYNTETILDLENFVYPIEGYNTFIRIEPPYAQGVMKNDNTEIIGQNEFRLGIFTYLGTDSYGKEEITYSCISNNSHSEQCKYFIVVCYLTCESCNSITVPSIDNQFCLHCNEQLGYAPIKDYPSNCLLIGNTNNGLTYDPINKAFICDLSCDHCTYSPSDNKCFCNHQNGYYFLEGIINKCYLKNDYVNDNRDYFLDGDNIIKKCYSTCDKCDSKGNYLLHQCTKCKSPFILQPNGNCICSTYLIYDEFDKPTCVEECPRDHPYYIPIINQCVGECPPELPLLSNVTCEKACLKGTFNYKGKCMNSCFPKDTSGSNAFIYIHHKVEECIETINENILDYYSIRKSITGIDFSLQINNLNEPFIDEKNMTMLYFTSCENTIREKYGIPLTDRILIAKFDLFRDKSHQLVNQVEYNAYDKYGSKLDLSKCLKDIVNISYPLMILSDINFTHSALILSQTGIDVFNHRLPVFNDYCYSFNLEDSDLTLTDRRNMCLNASFCEESCNYTHFNYSSMRAHCSCETKPRLSLEPSILSIPHFITKLPKTNLVISTCYSVFLTWKLLFNVIPFCIIGSFAVIQIIVLIIVVSQGDKKLYAVLHYYTSLQVKTNKKPYNSIKSTNSCPKKIESPQTIIPVKAFVKKEYHAFLKSIPLNQHNNLWSMFIDILIEKHPLLCFKAKVNIWTLNISRLLLHFSLSYVICCMFFNDSMISYKYVNKRYDLIPVYLNSLYTALLSGVILSLMNILLQHHHLFYQFQAVSLSIGKKKVQLVNALIIIFFIFGFILITWSFYYSTIFNVIYHQTQVMLLYTWLMSLGNMLLFRILLAFIISLLKYNSLIKPLKTMYSIATTLLRLL